MVNNTAAGEQSESVRSTRADGSQPEAAADTDATAVSDPIGDVQRPRRTYSILPKALRAEGNWKQIKIQNMAAALRAGQGCEAGPSDFVWERPEKVNSTFEYSEEILEQWR